MLRCSDGSLYTGITTDIDRRVKEHNGGKLGSKYVRTRLPAKLVYSEGLKSQQEAMKRELEIKSWHRKRKLQLISDTFPEKK